MKKIILLLLTFSLFHSFTLYAQQDTVDIKITGNYTFYLDVDEDEGTSDWYFSAYDVTGKYQVRLDYPSDEAGKYGTYTYNDIDRDYSYIKDFTGEEMEYREYQEGTVFTVSDNNGSLHIEGLLVCDNGVVYRLWMEHSPQTYNVEGTSLTDIYYFTEDTDWYMLFNNSNFRVSLDINTGDESKFEGTYTEADAVEGYNYVSDLNVSSTDYFKTFTVTLSLFDYYPYPTKACEITGTALTEHGDTYNFHMVKYPPITPTKHVSVDVSVDYFEWPSANEDRKAYFELTDKNNPDRKWTIGLNSLIGDVSTDDIIDTLTYCKNTQTGEVMKFDNGTACLTLKSSQDADSPLSILNSQLSLVMKDSVEYNFSFDCTIETRGNVDLAFSNLKLSNSSYSDVGYQWLDFSNDDATVEVTLTDDIPGDYDDTTASIEMVVKDDDGEMSAVSNLAIISCSTTLDEHNQPVFEAQFFGSDKKVYTLDAHLDIPAVADTLDIAMEGLKARDYINEIGAFQIFGYNNDSTVYVSLAPEATQFDGHYTTKDLAAYNSYCVLAMKKADGTYESLDFYTADFDVTRDDNIVSLTGKFQAGSHLVYLSLQAIIRAQGIDYDTEDENLSVTFAKGDLYDLEQSSNYAYLEFRNTARSDIFTILFYLNDFDDDIVIPAGTYDVNTTYNAPSVQPGTFYNGNLYPCFYGKIGSNDVLYQPFWFLTSGTVTVSKNLDKSMTLEVNGMNSYGCTMHVIYDGGGTGIADVLSTSVVSEGKKQLENGHIIIYKGSRKFTLEGQEIY